ncbi:hypothetical protein Mgra_00007068 [Meloidogyne graminicola]|uniref:phospholipase A2 n=1 Tax=Meloidogyne graminicola TaxID=189291 RepID=A0A8S9ZJX5_9BILA|nr:hypothetical protein Mgra_00007068 [Meloidogyne graminicola]
MEKNSTKATTKLASKTILLNTTTANTEISSCHPESFANYGCNCGQWKGNFAEINKCCKKHHECIETLKDKCETSCIKNKCQFYPAMNYSVLLNDSLYNWKCNEGEKYFQCLNDVNDECQQALCECDRSAAQCWVNIPEPAKNSNVCFSLALDLARAVLNVPFMTLSIVENQVNKSANEITLLLKNTEEGKDIGIKQAKITIKKAKYAVKEGIKHVIGAEDLVNSSLEIAKLKEEINYNEYETTKSDENKFKEVASFRGLMLNILAAKLFAEEKKNVFELMFKTADDIEKLEDYLFN